MKELNLVLIYNQKYFVYRFKQNSLADDKQLLDSLAAIADYIQSQPDHNNVKRYVLENDQIDQFVGNAAEVNTYKDLFKQARVIA